MKKIRNFCIIAHIDHGKSTLADRLLEATNTLKQAFPGWAFDYEEFVKFDMGDKYYPLEKQNLPQ